MKYAVISDIHGNIDALEAVLQDAAGYAVDRCIFAGDYCTNFPYPNEVIARLKRTKNAVFVCGNEDGRLLDYALQNQALWTDGQFQATYWSCRELREASALFLQSLPQKQTLTDQDLRLFVTHSSHDFIGEAELREFTRARLIEKYAAVPAKAVMQRDLKISLEKNREFGERVQSLAAGIYIFGHSHIQWSAQYGGRYFLNPGACGLPTDGDPLAPYSILEIRNGAVTITERRVRYDRSGLIRRFRTSDLYQKAEVWSRVIIKELETSYKQAIFFLQFAGEYADRIQDLVRPFSQQTWSEAFRLWSEHPV